METIIGIITAKETIWSVIWVIIAFIGTGLIRHAYKAYLKRTDNTMQTDAIVRTTFRGAKLLLWALVAFTILEINDINVTSIIAGVGVAGAVFGLAMQDAIKDVLMGIHIVYDHSFKVGDVIKLDGDEGLVTLFTLQTTQYVSLNTGDTVTICNRNISKVGVSSGVYDIDLGLSYNEDPDRIREVFEKCAAEISKIEGMADSKYMDVQRYESSAVIYRVRFWCDPKDKWPMWRAAMRVVHRHVIDNNIEIPYNQIDVHMPDASGPRQF